MGHHGNFLNLPKLDTHTTGMDMSSGLRTAPVYPGFGGFDLDQLFSPGNTVNPAQLHFGGGSVVSPATTSFQNISQFHTIPDAIEQDNDFSWMRNWDPSLTLNGNNEHAIDESSPSRISSAASQSGFSESVMDAKPGAMQGNWPQNDLVTRPMLTPAAFSLDALGSGLPNLDAPLGTVSPQSLHDNTPVADAYFERAMQQNNQADAMNGIQLNQFVPSLSNFGSDSPSISSSSVNGSARQSSVTSVSTESITDATRQALLISLSQPSVFGHNHRKYSQPTISSPLSPGGALRGPIHSAGLPSTTDLQRYVNAYINYFHPHMPFLHIPTLSFDSPDYVSNIRSTNGQTSFGHAGIVGGGGCLILAMSAIGALYEYDHQASRELFDAAKKMIQIYLEERRKADMSAAVNGSYVGSENAGHNTPLWLVQAMLLNVIYGHNCGDKTAADIASTHCAALVSLARAAELAQPPDTTGNDQVMSNGFEHAMGEQAGDFKMNDQSSPFNDQQQHLGNDTQSIWLKWKLAEERKRTLFAVFILSSLLVTAYNHTPAIMNSEILLDLPCEEDIWAAESAQEWISKGGLQAAEHNTLSFASALSTLLTASQRQQSTYGFNGYGQPGPMHMGNANLEPELRPSTFGCLVLINALHNYIWETRSRHHGRQWTSQETESMFSHIEPALNAWQAAWRANDHHKLQRPNVHGHGPLSADKAFWQRDFDAMADELARGVEITQNAESFSSNGFNPSATSPNGSAHNSPEGFSGSPNTPGSMQAPRRPSQMSLSGQGSKRERHLRKAAFYAADSLTISSKFNLTYADATSHELPFQSAMCFFDCAQVLAEWACTVQERIGRYLGVLGKAEIDYTQVPAIMLLETEDVELLGKIESICSMMEEKLVQQANILALANMDPTTAVQMQNNLPGLSECGLASKILMVTAYMLEKAAVWPVTYVMADALRKQASHMTQRAEASIV
ncbi:hypothetical protein H2203_003088 [Taxawa tesnikishii (nom. ined.)]|nr:hypothetical protein H2203_003088 [Dothideales sp. JES 119]